MAVTIVDFGVGNIGSIQNMLKKVGSQCVLANRAEDIQSATKLILPGVGSFDAGMQHLNDSGLRPALDDAVLVRKIPVAGICLGMQMMTQGSEEGSLPGLGWVPAQALRFRPSAGEVMKVPHMGWSGAMQVKNSVSLDLLEQDPRFYFVHSYYVICRERLDALLTARYGSVTFDAAFERGNILGFQFHPEKSHRFGLAILKAFVDRY